MACCGFRRAVLVAATLLLLAVVQTAQASDWKFGEPRYVSPDGGSSECIGKLISARCAVESFLACVARADVDLCQMATRKQREEFTGIANREPGDIRIDYQLESFERRKISRDRFEYQIELNERSISADFTGTYFIHTYIILRDDKGFWVQSWWSSDPD